MKRSEKQCESCIHHVNNQVGEVKDIMILNALKCSTGQDTELNERCTMYSRIQGSINKKLKPKLAAICIALLLLAVIADIGLCESPFPWTGNINAFLGVKALDEDDWEPIEDHEEYGIKIDFKQEGWPVSIAIDYLVSSDDDTALWYDPVIGVFTATVEGETSELCLGVRKIWDHFPTMRPFIGGGIARISAEAKVTALGFSASADDDAIGIWIGGGIYWTLAEHFNIGFDVRWSKAEVTYYGVDAEAGGTHAGLLLGFHW